MLVVVESPAKCKTIEGFLGPGYKCVATCGHFRKLKNLKSIQKQDDKYAPHYSVMESKHVETLRKQLKKAKRIFLATDNDREGEAIAWHVCDYFDLPIDTPRVLFNEITETCVLRAMENPTIINQSLVKAQQCRQMLDLYLGYKISPLIWKHVSTDRTLSAGRCQTPVLRLIYEKQKTQSVSFKMKGYFTSKNIPFETTIEEESCRTFLEHSANTTFTFTRTDVKVEIHPPPKPFTTSSLLQTVPLSSKEIMQCCCKLYEQGYITYPRTNSTFYAETFLNEISFYIEKNHGSKYVNISSLKQTNHPHEAIRVTDITLEKVGGTPKEKRVYDYIRNNTLASCMSDCILHTFEAILKMPFGQLKHKAELVAFDGWNLGVKGKHYEFLKNIPENTEIRCKKMNSDFIVRCEEGYTESSLILKMEELGIGKPSTFSSLVNKIQDRGYVIKKNVCKQVEKTVYELDGTIKEKKVKKNWEGTVLQITHTGIMVIEFLKQYFDGLFNYDYTRQLEEKLDKIAENQIDMNDTCEEYFNNVNSLSSCDIKVNDIQLEENKLLFNKRGSVLFDGETYTKVKQDIDLDKLRNGEYKMEEIVDLSNTDSKGSFMGEEIFIKKGRYGIYTTFRGKNISLYYYKKLPVEKISLENVIWAIQKNATKYNFSDI